MIKKCPICPTHVPINRDENASLKCERLPEESRTRKWRHAGRGRHFVPWQPFSIFQGHPQELWLQPPQGYR